MMEDRGHDEFVEDADEYNHNVTQHFPSSQVLHGNSIVFLGVGSIDELRLLSDDVEDCHCDHH